MSKYFRNLGKVCIYLFFWKSKNKQKLNILFCIMYKSHNSYFVLFVVFATKNNQTFNFLYCNMYKMHNSYFVLLENFVIFVNLGIWDFCFVLVYNKLGLHHRAQYLLSKGRTFGKFHNLHNLIIYQSLFHSFLIHFQWFIFYSFFVNISILTDSHYTDFD